METLRDEIINKLIDSNNEIMDFQRKCKVSKKAEEYLEYERKHMGDLHVKVQKIGDIDEMKVLNKEHEGIVKNIVERIPSIGL